jgi:hypothetical protein
LFYFSPLLGWLWQKSAVSPSSGDSAAFFSGFVVAASGKQLRSGEAFVTQVLVSILLAL